MSNEEYPPIISPTYEIKQFFSFIANRWKDRNENKFLLCRNFITQNRRLLSTIALEYYEQKGLSSDFPLIVDNWLPSCPIELKEIENKKYWSNKVSNISPFMMDSFLQKSSYAENIKSFLPEIPLDNKFTYNLTKIDISSESFSFTFSPSRYFDYINTCEVLSYEFCWMLLKKFGQNLIDENFDFNKLKFPLREKVDIFDLSNRSTAVGINTLLILLNKDTSEGNHYYYFHQRSKKLAEAMDTFHVVPAGTFQPDSFEDNFHERDFNLFRNIMREFAEELCCQQIELSGYRAHKLSGLQL